MTEVAQSLAVGMAESPEDHYYRGRRLFLEQIVRLVESGQECGRSLDKALMTLSGGALVFSMTFVGTLAPARLGLMWLFLSWAAFGVAIIAVAWAMRREQETTHEMALLTRKRLDDWDGLGAEHAGLVQPTIDVGTNTRVAWLNMAAIAFFSAGAIMLCVFVALNLLAKHVAATGPGVIF